MKSKVLVLHVSRYQLDNGHTGGKIQWTDLNTTANENARGLGIYTAAAPYTAYSALPEVPCVAEIDYTLKAKVSGGKAETVVVVESVAPLAEKKFSSTSAEYVCK